MIKMLFFFLLIGCFTQTTNAQKKYLDVDTVSIPESNCKSVEDLSAYIKQHFATDTSRVRAIYLWVANHIRYDLNRMQRSINNPQTEPQTVADVLRVRSAVCQGYSELFTALCKSVGINTILVGGYAKIGDKTLPMAHAWVAAEFDGEWFLFDPTWGAGYVANNQFVKQFTNAFYKQSPKEMIADHMPFDPLYQFLSYPKSNREFIDGTLAANKLLFNYKDSLQQYTKLSPAQQTTAQLRRLEAAGIENDLLRKEKEFLKKNLQIYSSENANDGAQKNFARAVTLLNEYYGEKNKQFSNISDNDLLIRLDSMKHHIKLARSFASEAIIQNEEQQRIKSNNLASMDKYWAQLNQEELFIKLYIDTDKPSRRRLFMR
ncbi:MAG: transglutaminase domain-containing protein [Ferruginibacter sp.]